MEYSTNLLVPTINRRRTKGRLPFIDSAETVFQNENDKLENEMNIPENELDYNFSENLDDVDEEQVTIDLSEFLNENPLLTEPSENLADSAATLTDCHSQFRVTSSLADPSPVAIEEISSQKDSSINRDLTTIEKCSDISETGAVMPNLSVSEMPPNILSESNIPIDSPKISIDTVSNISSHKENILSVVKSTLNKNHKVKSTKTTNLFQNYRSTLKLKDFNKNNLKVFGKYPVVKCEKLDIEKFIRTNSIKVGNWPIKRGNNHFKTKSHPNKSNTTRKYKSQSIKVPKLINKPITFNRCVTNSPNLSTVNKARSILIDALAANSSPLIIKTNSWKPEIANVTGGSTKFVNSESFHLPTSQQFNKPVGNQRIIKLVQASSPLQINKFNTQAQKLPIITSVNKLTVGSKTFQLVSPNTFVASKPEKSKAITPILPKPSSEIISPVFLKDYTVIQPYVEDPTSPVKPKPLLTVPLDIVPVANAFNQSEFNSTVTEMHSPIKSPLKPAKPVQSVFLNGAINQISSPVAIDKESPSISVTELLHYNEENISERKDKLNKTLPMSSKSPMIDAVTSIFSKPLVRKQSKSKQNLVGSNRRGDSSVLGCKAYNTTLDDLLFNDFTDESYSLDDSIHISSDICPTNIQSPDIYHSDWDKVEENSTEESTDEEIPKDKVFSKQKVRKKKNASPHDSDTLSASEGEDNKQTRKKIVYSNRKYKTPSVNLLKNHIKSAEPSKSPVFDSSQQMPSEKLIGGTVSDEYTTSSEKRKKHSKRAETIKSSENSPEPLQLSKETTLKSETSFISNANLENDEGKICKSKLGKADEKLDTAQESKIGVNNLRNRHKTTFKRQTAATLVKSKRVGYAHAKFKGSSKKMSNNKVKVMQKNKKSKPTDIIKEIKTITGGTISNKKLQTKRSTISEKANHPSSKNLSTRAKNESKPNPVSKSPKQRKKGLAVRSKTKKRTKTLKVLFKRSTPKSKSLEIPLDDINHDLLDNENNQNSISENNTNLNSTFRDAKSHNMATPSKEEHKHNADILPTKLNFDDSSKENELFSNGIDDNSSIGCMHTKGEDSYSESNNIGTSGELKPCNISDKDKAAGDVQQNKKINVDQQQNDITDSNENFSPFQQENNSNASNDFNLALTSTEDLSNNFPEGAASNLKDETQSEDSVESSCAFSKDIMNENKSTLVEKIKDPVEDVDANNLKSNESSTSENAQELDCKLDVDVLLETTGLIDNSMCDNSNEIISPSEGMQKLNYNHDKNTVIEDTNETNHTCQEVPKSNLNSDTELVKNKEIAENIKNKNIHGENFENSVDEVNYITPACGDILKDVTISEQTNVNHIPENCKTQKDSNTVLPNEEIQNHNHNSVSNVVDQNIREIKVVSQEISNNESEDSSVTKEVAPSCETLQKNINSDDIVIKNASCCSTIDDTLSIIEAPLITEIEKSPEKKRGRKPKRKSCPKIKISVAKKTDHFEPTSLKNWYVSERKESTDSTQSEEPLKKDNFGHLKRGRRKLTEKFSSPLNTSDNNERVCFETVAEIHAVDTGTITPYNKASSKLKAISNNVTSDFVHGDSSAISLAADLCNDSHTNEVSSRSANSPTKRKSASLKSSINVPVKIKDEPMSISTNSTSRHPDSIAYIKLENEEIEKAMEEITVVTTHLRTRRGRHSASAIKKAKFAVVSAEPSIENQVAMEAIKKSNSKSITDLPSEQPSRKSKKLETPASHPRNRKKSYSPKTAVSLPQDTKKYSSKVATDSPSEQTSCKPANPEVPPAFPINRKKNYSPEAVIVPFKMGWMRELVHRSTDGIGGKRASDVYYFSPEGKKLRSMIEISGYLSTQPENKLGIENFTFFKELVYREPFEIQRSAKQKSDMGKIETSKQTSMKQFFQPSTTCKSSPLQSSTKLKKKDKTSINSFDGNTSVVENELQVKSPVTLKAKKKTEKSVDDSNTVMDTVETNVDVDSRPSRRSVKKVPFDNCIDDQSQLKPKRGRPSKCLNTSVCELESTKKVNIMKSQVDSSESTIIENSCILNKNYNKNTTTTRNPKQKLMLSKNTDYGDIQPPCSPRCHIAAIQRPSIQCAICLCFFHPNCIPKLAEKVIFACKPCTTQKFELYDKEYKSESVSESFLSPEDTISFDHDIDISLLAPEVILNEKSEPIIFPPVNETNVFSENVSFMPHRLSQTISAAVPNAHIENRPVSSPHLLSHLLQPPIPLALSKPLNQNSTRLLLTKETASKILQFGMRFTPGANISSPSPFVVRRLPDGRRITLRKTSNLASSPNSLNNSTLQTPVSNVNPNIQVLSNISKLVNGNSSSNKARPNTVRKVSGGNRNFLLKDHSLNFINSTDLLLNTRTGNNSFISKNSNSFTSVDTSESDLPWDMNKLMTSCKSLLLVFKRLSVPDLLRASQVCSYWKYVSSQSDLWEKVSLQGLTVTNWEKCCLALQKHGTKALDLRGIVHHNATNPWEDLETHVIHLTGIEELIFDQITPSLLKSVVYNMPLLRKLECHFVTTACSEPEIWTVPCKWELSSLRYLGRLVKLKIASGSRIELKNEESYVMPYLPQLRHVALTGFNFCSNVNLESLSKQKELISLELGDCKEIEPGIYALLENLTSLKSLRLENGGSLDDCRLSETLLKIKGLEVLELMNFKISQKLSEALRTLKHLIHLNVWPDNTEKGAVVNRNLFNAVSSCKALKYFCWGVISEGENIPQFLEMENSNKLTFENLFYDLVALFPECRVEVKCAPRSSWREFCSTRK